MKKFLTAIPILFLFLNSCSNSGNNSTASSDTAKKLPVVSPIGEGENEITVADYQTIIKKQNIVLVDFGAKWCVYCKKLAPLLDDLVNNSMPGKFLLVKSDTDRDQALANSLQITG